MPPIQLKLYIDPGEVEVVCNVLRTDGLYERLTAVVDTGAAVSLLPNDLLNRVQQHVSQQAIIIDQAGIAKQSFQAIEAYVTMFLEDQSGNRTNPFEILAWFAETDTPLIGFEDVLDRAVLHIDMLAQQGWLDINV